MRVDRTSLLEVWYEALDALHHAGLYHTHTEESSDPQSRVARCTCHRDVVHMETLEDLIAGTSHRSFAQADAASEDVVVRAAERETEVRGVPELCWECCDSWEEAIAEPHESGCLPRYEECYERYDDDEKEEFLECVAQL